MAVGFASGTFEKIADGVYRVKLARGFASAHPATGMEKLAFEVIYTLFTTEGSLPFDPTKGTQLMAIIGQTNFGADDADLAATIIAEVIKAEGQVLASQVEAVLPDAEKLKSLLVAEITVDEPQQEVSFRLAVVNALDQLVGLEIVTDRTTGGN